MNANAKCQLLRSSAGPMSVNRPYSTGWSAGRSPSCTTSRALRAIVFPAYARGERDRSVFGTQRVVGAGETQLTRQVRQTVEEAIRISDVLLLVVDAQQGVSPIDLELADCCANRANRSSWPSTD